MKKIKNNVTLLNVISNMLLQLTTIISGFIIPRVILVTFGSEVNGLTSSLNQFLNYITIFEGGLGGVVLANLYKPLYKKDDKSISSVVKTTHDFYQKLGFIFMLYTLALGIIYPFVTHTSFSFAYIFLLTIILSVTLFVQYNFSLHYKLLLQADKKIYVVSGIQILLTILNVALFIIFSNIYPSIHILKLVSAIVFILQPVLFGVYVKKHYNIEKKAKSDNNLLKSRWDGFAINIAAFVHNNTDVGVLTIFTSLKTVSVYSVYALVSTGIKKLLQSASSAIGPTIGHAYAKNDLEELNHKFDMYEYIMFLITFFMYTVGGLLISSFVLLYTKKVTDINYYQPLFGILLMFAELLYCIREPYVNLAYSANKFKEIKKPAYIEAAVNIILSIILVNFFGIIGVAIGTAVAMFYRTIFHVWYLKNNIINRSPLIFIKKFVLFSVASLIGIFICYYIIPIKATSIFNFILCGVIYSTVVLLQYLIVSILFFRGIFSQLIKNIKR